MILLTIILQKIIAQLSLLVLLLASSSILSYDNAGILSLTTAWHQELGFRCLLIGERHAPQSGSETETITRNALYRWLQILLHNRYKLHLESTQEFAQAAYAYVQNATGCNDVTTNLTYSLNNLSALNHLSILASTNDYQHHIELTDIRTQALGDLATLFAEFEMYAADVHASCLENLKNSPLPSAQLLHAKVVNWAEDPLIFLNKLFFDKQFQNDLALYNIHFKTYVSQLYDLMVTNTTTVGDVQASLESHIKIIEQLLEKSSRKPHDIDNNEILDADAVQLWQPLHVALLQGKQKLTDYIFNRFSAHKNIGDACFELFQLNEDFHTFFGNNETSLFMHAIAETILHHLANFHFIRRMLVSQKSILYAGNAHCLKISTLLQRAGFITKELANNNQPLTQVMIDTFFSTPL